MEKAYAATFQKVVDDLLENLKQAITNAGQREQDRFRQAGVAGKLDLKP